MAKVCVVTGGGSGLGRATARRLVSPGGHHVVVLDKDPPAPTDEMKDLIYLQCDVCKEEDVKSSLMTTEKRYGRVNVLVCCAGVWNGLRSTCDPVSGKPADMTWIRQAVEVDLFGTINTIRLATGFMLKNQPDEDGERGVIIITSSTTGMDTFTHQVGHVAAKGALLAVTPSLAAEFAPLGIRVNAICPGPMDTPMGRNMTADKREGGASQAVICPTRCHLPPRAGTEEEFAHLCHGMVRNKMCRGEVRRDAALLPSTLKLVPNYKCYNHCLYRVTSDEGVVY